MLLPSATDTSRIVSASSCSCTAMCSGMHNVNAPVSAKALTVMGFNS